MLAILTIIASLDTLVMLLLQSAAACDSKKETHRMPKSIWPPTKHKLITHTASYRVTLNYSLNFLMFPLIAPLNVEALPSVSPEKTESNRAWKMLDT